MAQIFASDLALLAATSAGLAITTVAILRELPGTIAPRLRSDPHTGDRSDNGSVMPAAGSPTIATGRVGRLKARSGRTH